MDGSNHFVSFRFVSFRFVSFRFVSFRFVSFRFVSFRFVSSFRLTRLSERSFECRFSRSATHHTSTASGNVRRTTLQRLPSHVHTRAKTVHVPMVQKRVVSRLHGESEFRLFRLETRSCLQSLLAWSAQRYAHPRGKRRC